MSADRCWPVSRLRENWRNNAVLTSGVESALDAIGFDNRFAMSGSPPPGKRKHLKDNVWGMIEFEHAEIQLIDSPLLQRLRGVRQLGFSYLVYPSAEHTRFVHTLGMAHVVASFAASIERNAGRPVTESMQVKGYTTLGSLAPLTRQELVFAALLHDVGHMPFSHASEASLAQHDALFTCGGVPLPDVLTEARHAFKKDISLSEMLSILIVLSKRFAAYFAHIVAQPADRCDESLVRIACLIAGVPATSACPNIQEIISAAAVDADKIDYVARDAAACGISIGVDDFRIFMGSGLVDARRDAYDETYEGDERSTVFVINSSGADTLDEIVQARSALYQRVYLHPVTRTAEALLSRALHLNAGLTKEQRREDLVDALGLWAMDDAALILALSNHRDHNISLLADRLKRRRLPKKACALAASVATMQTPLRAIFRQLDPTLASSIKKDLANTFIEKLTRKRIVEIGAAIIEEQIRAEATALATSLSKGGSGYLVPADPLDLVIVTPIAAMDGSRPDALVFQAGELIRTPALTNVQGQHDAQDIFKAVGYVLCDPAWRTIVMIATRSVVLALSEATAVSEVRHKLLVGEKSIELAAKRRTILDFDGVTRRANIPRSSAESVMRSAAEVGYFDTRPTLYLPTEGNEPEVQTVARSFRGFSGELGWCVDKTTVASFVDQLPPGLRVSMLDMLKKGTLLDQGTMFASLMAAIGKSRVGAEPVIACPLSLSSGGLALAIVKAAGMMDVRTASNLKEALSFDGEPLILLVDDNAASGVQASAQLYAHAGIAKVGRPEPLSREDDLFEGELNPDEIQRLRTRRFAIAVAVGLDDASTYSEEAARTLGFTAFQGVKYGTPIAGGLNWSADLKTYLSHVGRELMAYRYERRSFSELEEGELKSRCEHRAFGYGGHGGIMATHSNVPSSTVTALWQPGVFHGRPWTPLFIRRGLLKELVLG